MILIGSDLEYHCPKSDMVNSCKITADQVWRANQCCARKFFESEMKSEFVKIISNLSVHIVTWCFESEMSGKWRTNSRTNFNIQLVEISLEDEVMHLYMFPNDIKLSLIKIRLRSRVRSDRAQLAISCISAWIFMYFCVFVFDKKNSKKH